MSPSGTALKPLVGIIMGSDSDLPVMQAAADVLTEFGVPLEIHVVSAHRTPSEMLDYGRSAAKRGLHVIIAGAGGSAHLPGMVASVTTLPVIGVPVPLQHLSGLDSLLSIVQMPAGIPVATMSIGGARNAGILAARILALGDRGLAKKLDAYARRLSEETHAKDAGLRRE
jgi:5-(carboxyamino)imidazole ribonucleotide mutase